ncbi:MAG TPA: Omp28-related outer membrane protein [Candidatus Cloacimonadota bacterium]|nr:Omp28-related outer membrane protein [Candidatus Cloacimonadota bacterium]HQH50434.1 Omp28-related outer membrane protein [Candidatus Cloacimonadota bacterium]
MKKSLIVLLTLLGLLSSVLAVPRNLVVVEVATGTWCGYCPGAAMGCHDLLQNGHAVAIIKNHGSDNYANTYSNARNSFYGVTGFPTAVFDGQNPSVGGSSSSSMYSNYLPKVNSRLSVPSHFLISAVGAQNGSEYNVTVTVSKPEADTNTNVKLHAVLTESNIPHVWFNQTTVENVNRLMVPSENGSAINLATGETTTVNLTFTPNSTWNIANCEMVFFLQNMTSKEILQGVKYSLASLVGAYPVSHQSIDFPDVSVNGTNTIPITITNFASTAANGTITISSPVFSCDVSNFNIPAAQSITANVTFSPTAPQTYTGNLVITSNLYNHPNITIPLTGTGFTNEAPVATSVVVTGIPVVHQQLSGEYVFTDADSDTEGSSIYKWYRIVNSSPVLINGANEPNYTPVEADIDHELVFEVTPVDEHNMPGTPVSSAPTPTIIDLPAPQNLAATLNPPNTVVLTWEPPQYFGGRAFVGYRLFRNGLSISTITNPNTLTFTDTYVPQGVHEYWICSLFNDPMMLSGPSNTVTINTLPNDDDVISAGNSLNVYPNPFRSSTSFALRGKANRQVNISIYNVKGQLVRSMAGTTDQNGEASLNWDGTNSSGNKVDSGVYYYQLNSPDFKHQGRIVLMK